MLQEEPAPWVHCSQQALGLFGHVLAHSTLDPLPSDDVQKNRMRMKRHHCFIQSEDHP